MKQEKLQYTSQETMFMNPILYGTVFTKDVLRFEPGQSLGVFFFKCQPLNKSIKWINTSMSDTRAVYVNIITLKNLISCDSKHKGTRAH